MNYDGLLWFYRDMIIMGSNLTGILIDVPSGYVKIAIEHGNRKNEFTHENGDLPLYYVDKSKNNG